MGDSQLTGFPTMEAWGGSSSTSGKVWSSQRSPEYIGKYFKHSKRRPEESINEYVARKSEVYPKRNKPWHEFFHIVVRRTKKGGAAHHDGAIGVPENHRHR